MVDIFGHQHMRQQRRTGAAALDRQRRQLRLGDGLALPAAQLRPDVDDDLKKCEGTYSKISRSSVPMRLSLVLPQAGQAQAAACSTCSRGKYAGIG